MTNRDDKLDRLQAASESIGDQTYEDLENQAKLVASNCFLLMGDKTVLSAAGFIVAAIQIHQSVTAWLVAEGYATLTEKALATPAEVQRRQENREAPGVAAAAGPTIRPEGGYL